LAELPVEYCVEGIPDKGPSTMKLSLTLLAALMRAPLCAARRRDRQAVAPLPGLHSIRFLPAVPNFGKLCVDSFQPLENSGALSSIDWKLPPPEFPKVGKKGD
jgi:hypothetical protein